MSKASASTHSEELSKLDAEWRAQLTPEQFYVTRRHGAERAGASPLNKEKRVGACTCCGEPLFRSEAKFNGAALSFKQGDP